MTDIEQDLPCKVCGNTASSTLLTARSLDRLDGLEYRYLRCDNCGLVILEGATGTRAEDYEESGYYSKRSPLIAPLLDSALQLVERLRLRTVRRLAPDLPTGRVLEIGSGKGRFLRCAKAQGWDTIGLEPLQRDSVAESPVVRDSLRPDLWDQEQFDLITLWHTLEHLPEPLWALRIAHTWLKRDGALALGVPNLASWQARIGKGIWFHLDPPRHLHHFTPATLRSILETAGFSNVKITFPLFDLNILGMPLTVLNKLGFTPNLLYNFLKRNRAGLPGSKSRLTIGVILCIVSLALLSVPLAFLTLAESLLKQGGTMIAVARKRCP